MECYYPYTVFNVTFYLIFFDEMLTEVSWHRPACRCLSLPLDSHSYLKSWLVQFDRYFQGESQKFFPTSFSTGTSFQQKVWHMLCEIPYGETWSYSQLANKVGCIKGRQAIGQALKKNPLPFIYPCHRVIQASGELGGYAGGKDFKRFLLELEQSNF